MNRTAQSLLAAVAIAASGCSAGLPNHQSFLPSSPAGQTPAHIAAMPQSSGEVIPSVATSGPTLYVALNTKLGEVAVYNGSGPQPIRTITRAIDGPTALAVDSTGKLWVANYKAVENNAVTEYAAGTSAFVRGFLNGNNGPDAIAADAFGDVAVANTNYYYPNVAVYPNGLDISNHVDDPVALAYDASRNLYVANGSGSVTVYAASGKLVRTIDNGHIQPQALAIDPSQNLYVAGWFDYTPQVQVYAPGKTTPSASITQGIDSPVSVAFARDLYVANCPSCGYGSSTQAVDSVTVYAPGGTKPIRTLTIGFDIPRQLATDKSGNLYVMGTASIAVYAPGASKPSRIIPLQISPAAIDVAN